MVCGFSREMVMVLAALRSGSREPLAAIINEQLQTALTNRVVIEQAKRRTRSTRTLDIAQAVAVLGRDARDHNLRPTDVARAVVSRSLSAEQLIDSAREA
jgi:hypothetical protein